MEGTCFLSKASQSSPGWLLRTCCSTDEHQYPMKSCGPCAGWPLPRPYLPPPRHEGTIFPAKATCCFLFLHSSPHRKGILWLAPPLPNKAACLPQAVNTSFTASSSTCHHTQLWDPLIHLLFLPHYRAEPCLCHSFNQQTIMGHLLYARLCLICGR